MSIEIMGYRVFIAAPSGLEAERKLFLETIQDYNRNEAIHRAIQYIPVRWEETLGGVGRPQELINEDLRECDYMVLLLWDRWGSRTDRKTKCRYSSGTEEEFEVAKECYNDREMPMRNIVIFFKDVEDRMLSDPGRQLKKVLKFKQTLQNEKTHHSDTYETPEDFSNRLRAYLGRWMRDHEQGLSRLQDGNSELPVFAPKTIKHIPLPGEKPPLLNASIQDKLDRAKKLADKGNVYEAESMYAELVTSTQSLWPKNEYAKFLFRIGKRNKAEGLYKQILHETNKTSDAGWQGRASANLGLILQSRGELTDAENLFLESLAFNEKLNHKEGIADSKRRLSLVYRSRGDLSKALTFGNKALSIYLELKDLGRGGLADTYADLGIIYRIRGELNKAEEYYLNSLKINRSERRRACKADNYGQLGTVYRARGNLKKAEELYSKAKIINEELNRKQGLADDLGHIGLVYLIKSNYKEAKALLHKSLDINEELQCKEGMAKQHATLARLYWSMKEYRAAENKLSISLKLNREMHSKEGMAANYFNFGSLYILIGDYPQAQELTARSLDINEEICCKKGLANGYLQLANINKYNNKFIRAKELANKSLDISNMQGFGLTQAEANYTLGLICHQEGNEVKSKQYFLSARQLYNDSGLDRFVSHLDDILDE